MLSKFDRIANHIEKDLSDAELVTFDFCWYSFIHEVVEFKAFLYGQAHVQIIDLLEKRRQMKPFHGQLDHACFDL